MPKIFALRHQLQEQQARLKQQSKNGSLDLSVRNGASSSSSSPPSSGDEAATAPQNLTIEAVARQQQQQHVQPAPYYHVPLRPAPEVASQPPSSFYQHPHLPLDLGRAPVRHAGRKEGTIDLRDVSSSQSTYY